LQLKKVFIDYENSNYEPAIEQVAYLPQDYRVVPDLGLLAAQEALKLNDLEPSPALAELSIQSAELIEQLQLSAADYVQEQESYVGKFRFNDDIPTLLAKASPNSINRHRRLIVIGIENYRYTHPVAFSRRSAELFVQVAQKTLGVSAENTLSLIDYDATSGAMKDSLRLFLKDIDEQDEIVFYYSGHGIPDPGDRNEPYILPIDKAPSYVSEDKAFQLAHMYKQLSDSGANKIVAIIDSCFSGVSDGKSLFEGVAAARLVPRIADFDRKKMVVLTAGKGDQFSNMYK
jgi:hypothetical protein